MYTLEAILGHKQTLINAAVNFSNVKMIQLSQEICIIPVVSALLQELEIRYQGGTKVAHPERYQFSKSLLHPTFERLIAGLDQFARVLSRYGLVAYLEAIFTGGYGGHATIMWEQGKRCDPLGDNVNTVLKQLGVVRAQGFDEFDTVGLGRYRSTRQWLYLNEG